ncbi:autotransporter assembly complex protein TamA [Desertibaculum subflavum]|uniref:autotransporter assembly complex protein TamA n=1 Tax=Desertibaculum subflavum TaxID=2268458 RepID=UPI000E6652BF
MRALFCALILTSLVSAAQARAAEYQVEISGIEDEKLAELVDAVSVLRARADRPPHSEAGLRRRIAEDRARVEQALRSEGYYQGTYRAEVDRSVEPTKVQVEVAPGPRFRIGQFETRLVEGAPGLLGAEKTKDLPAHGSPARAPDIVDAEARLLAGLAERGHPFAKVIDRKVVVDHATETVNVTLAIDAGSPAVFGRLDLEGLDDVRAAYVRRQVTWKEGEPYDQRKVDGTRRALARTGLFDSVRIGQPASADNVAEQRVPMGITLAESDHRSIGATAEYATDVGPGGSVFWEHRNLFGSAERLNLTAEGSLQRWALRGQFGKPGFPTRDDTFSLTSEVKDERLDAYDSRGASTTVGVTRSFGGGLSGSLGLGAEVTRITDNADTETFFLLSLPGQVAYDTTDAPLDPSRGLRATFGYTPYLDLAGEAGTFHRLRVSIASYFPVIEEKKRLVLAARLSAGSLFGAAVTDIPASARFYAGGGALRGYAYQLAGPLDADKDPVGGKSAIEASLEARIRVTEDFGVVPFIDAGNAYRNTVPNPGGDIRVAAGIGIRYFTSFAPIRADIAFPLNGRSGIDDAFQFYVGIGQAF